MFRPPQHREPLPTLVWIYPREYDDPELAEQLDVRPYRYHSIEGPSPISVVLTGYAVVVFPSIPVVQDAQHGQDSYIAQLVANAGALLDYLVSAGIRARQRIAIGGRS